VAVVAPSAVRKQIATGRPDPIYLLQGEDEVEMAALAGEFAELVDEGLRAFNVERIHAGDWTSGDRLVDGVATVLMAARTLPMMTPRRVVIVTHAEPLFAPKRESEAATRAHEALESLLESPEPHTTLVFVAGTLDKRSRIVKLIGRHATVVDCGVLEDRQDAERWVRARIRAAGVEIDPKAAMLLAARAGPNVRRLRNDVDRLLLYTLGAPRISETDVRDIAGAAELQDDWAMTAAIEAGDTAEALRQLALMLDAGAPPEMIVGQLGWVVRAKFPALGGTDLPAAVEALFRTDLDLKRSAGDPRVLLERLVVELSTRRRRGRDQR
jgi:DNA polymerase-3 subunit delta